MRRWARAIELTAGARVLRANISSQFPPHYFSRNSFSWLFLYVPNGARVRCKVQPRPTRGISMPAIRVAPSQNLYDNSFLLCLCLVLVSVQKMLRFMRTSSKHDRIFNGDADVFATAVRANFSKIWHFSRILFNFKYDCSEESDCKEMCANKCALART